MSPFVAAIALSVFSLILGLYHVGTRSFWDDEAFSYYAAQLSWPELWRLSIHVDPHTTLWHVILKGWYALHDGNEVWGRTPSAVAGAATVISVWILCRKLFNERVAIVAGVFCALHTTLISFQQDGRPYTLATFLTTYAVYRFVILCTLPTRRNAVLCGAFAASALYAHPFTILVFICIMPTTFLLPNQAAVRSLAPWATGSFLIAGMPCFLLIGANIGHDNLTWIPSFKWVLVRNCVSLVAGTNNAMMFLIEAVIVVAGVAITVKKNISTAAYWPYAVVVAWLVGVPVLALVADMAEPILTPRYLLPAVPAFSIVLAIAVEVCCSSRRFVTVALASVLSVLLFMTGIFSGTDYNVNNDWRQAVDTVTVNAQSGDKVLAFHHEPVFRYYLRQHTGAPTLPFLVNGGQQNGDVAMLRLANSFAFNEQTAKLASETKTRIWVVRLEPSPNDAKYLESLPENLPFITQKYGTFHHVEVELLIPASALTAS